MFVRLMRRLFGRRRRQLSPEHFAQRVEGQLAESRDPNSLAVRRQAARLIRRR